jgi:hypothetical protein
MSKSTWTDEELSTLYDLRTNEGLSWGEIEKILDRGGAQQKYSRMDWEDFLRGEEERNNDPVSRQGVWSQTEMIRLHSYLDSGQGYEFIADKLGRSKTAVERKAQTTDWNAWHEATIQEALEDEEDDNHEHLIEQLVHAMVSISRHDYNRLSLLKKDDFLEMINLGEGELPVSFTEIKGKATQHLDDYGLGNPEELQLGEGTYIIVGDSHGKHTKKKMFNLINNVSKHVGAEKVIHIGHMLDDDNDISYCWSDIDNLVILAKSEELKLIHPQRNKFGFNFDIVKESVTIGNDLIVMNQDLIRDYVKTPIRNLDSEIFDEKVVVNCHRMEMSSKAAGEESTSFFASPGALCERHIIKTIKQIDFQDKRTVKVAYHGGFIKYRRMKFMYKYWNQGMLIVNVDAEGDYTIIPCLIQKDGNEYVTSYFDKIISSKGVYEPTKKIFVHADMHAPNHDPEILDIQEQVCKAYQADALVNIGDSLDCETLSHHDIDKKIVIFGDYLEETAKVYAILKRMAEWTKDRYIIVGNHERFIEDFVKKYPQLSSILDFNFVCDVEGLGYEITPLKKCLKIGSAQFIHGDLLFYNQTGNKLEKTSRTFGHNTFIGHIHYPSIRFGCYSVGFAGQMDQGYNEPNASAWIHGLGLCNQYKGKSWPTTVAIFNKKFIVNGKTYVAQDPDSWNITNFKAKMVYELNGNQE